MFKKQIRACKLILLYIAITISLICYLPYIYLNDALYSLGRLGIYLTMGYLVVSSFSIKICNSNKFLWNLFKLLLIVSYIFLILYAFSLSVSSSDLIQIYIPFLCAYITYYMNLSEEQMSGLTLYYIVLGIVVATISVGTFLGFSAEVNPYLLEGKNQIGIIVSTVSGFSLFMCVSKNGKIERLFYLLCFIFSFTISTIIRCRSSLLGLIILIFIVLFKMEEKIYRRYVIFLILIFSPFILEVIFSAFVGDSDINDINGLSTGRMDRNVAALSYIVEHPFEGEFFETSNIPLIHNYVLLRFVRYGMCAIFFLLYYLLFITRSLSIILCSDSVKLNYMGYYSMIVPYIVSLLEPGAPFGPSSLYIFSFLLLGYSLRNS